MNFGRLVVPTVLAVGLVIVGCSAQRAATPTETRESTVGVSTSSSLSSTTLEAERPVLTVTFGSEFLGQGHVPGILKEALEHALADELEVTYSVLTLDQLAGRDAIAIAVGLDGGVGWLRGYGSALEAGIESDLEAGISEALLLPYRNSNGRLVGLPLVATPWLVVADRDDVDPDITATSGTWCPIGSTGSPGDAASGVMTAAMASAYLDATKPLTDHDIEAALAASQATIEKLQLNSRSSDSIGVDALLRGECRFHFGSWSLVAGSLLAQGLSLVGPESPVVALPLQQLDRSIPTGQIGVIALGDSPVVDRAFQMILDSTIAEDLADLGIGIALTADGPESSSSGPLGLVAEAINDGYTLKPLLLDLIAERDVETAPLGAWVDNRMTLGHALTLTGLLSE